MTKRLYMKYLCHREYQPFYKVLMLISCAMDRMVQEKHTVFGPPGLMAQAGSGALGGDLHAEYGLCPRGLLDIMGKLEVLS